MNIVCIGAHPDDPEVFAGGALIQWSRAGHRCVLASLTDGSAGHQTLRGADLAARRREEAARAAAIAGGISRILPFPDGRLEPTLEVRDAVVRLIREFEADVVLCHRPWDYHPDHRYTAIAVQDAAYLVMVPNLCPDSPPLQRNPIFLYLMDRFSVPAPFRADYALDISGVISAKLGLLDAHASQFYEWLPWIEGYLAEVPGDPDARRQWLDRRWSSVFSAAADRFRNALAAHYGETQSTAIRYAEAFQLSEYGRTPTAEDLAALLLA